MSADLQRQSQGLSFSQRVRKARLSERSTAAVMLRTTCSMNIDVRAATEPLSRPSPSTVRQQAGSSRGVSRRELGRSVLLGTALTLVASSPALALIPDDDDEELVQSAKANRQKRLNQERDAEKEFAKSSGFADNQVVAVQRAVNELAKSGEALAADDLPGVASIVGESWLGEFQKAQTDLSTSEAAKKSAPAVIEGIGALKSAAKGGSALDAKRNFVDAVSALQAWADDAGIASSLKGL